MELISEVLREVSTKVILYNSMAEVLYIDKPLIRQIEQGNSLKKKPDENLKIEWNVSRKLWLFEVIYYYKGLFFFKFAAEDKVLVMSPTVYLLVKHI